MLFHILGWASMDFRDKTKNLMVIIDRFYLCSSEFVRVLRHLERRGFNVISMLPPDEAVSKELLRDADSISNCTVNTMGVNPMDRRLGGDDVKTYGIPRVIDLIFTLEWLFATGYNAFLVQPNLLAPEISQTSEWPGHLLDVGEVIGRYKPDPSQKKRMRKKKKPRK
ncbi:unnamed protein product, partial [Arabidopsis halleri]